MIRIVYASSVTNTFDPERDLEDILAKSRGNNAVIDVTGILLFHEGKFIQVLEGEAQAVDDKYAAITTDPRHTDVLKYVRQEIEERSFSAWSMGFSNLKKSDLRDFPGAFDFKKQRSGLQQNALPKAVEALLMRFCNP